MGIIRKCVAKITAYHSNIGDISPETAVTDPVTGKKILNYAQIDPSHFGREVTIQKTTTPISRDQFFEGIKHLGPSIVKQVEGGNSSDDEIQQYGDGTVRSATTSTSQKSSTPTVVKTTTKQVLTKNDGGVTHNVEEEIHNLGTGEVLFSTQEHKVPTRISENTRFFQRTKQTKIALLTMHIQIQIVWSIQFFRKNTNPSL